VGTKEPLCSLGYQLHSLTAARTCAIDDQLRSSGWALNAIAFIKALRLKQVDLFGFSTRMVVQGITLQAPDLVAG